MPNLFPVFEFSSPMAESAQEPREKYSVYFDFQKGDFISDTGGHLVKAEPFEAFEQWCIKTIYTQRFSCLAYSSNQGIEAEEAFLEPTRTAQESALERTITEALMSDPYKRTSYVRSFSFEWDKDSVQISFTVGSIWKEAVLSLSLHKSTE